MDSNALLITANVGSLFENLELFIEPWLNQFSQKLSDLRPDFVSLHMQEVGGKNYKESMQSITPFFKKFLDNEIIKNYDRYLICVDSDFTDESTFTSLSNIYLIHNSVDVNDAQIFDFTEKKFFNFKNKLIFTGNLKDNDLVFKERFAKDLFKEFAWSRKGFLQTRWKIKNRILDLVNIHLFHDPSNLTALGSTPSIYSEYRRRALEYSIKRIKSHQVGDETSYLAIFGDFNFRLDLASLIDNYANKKDSIEIKDHNNKLSRLVCKLTDQHIFTIEEKTFKWHNDFTVQSVKNDLLKYDIELSLCNEPLFELEKTFPPSYPFMEELEYPGNYMETRCPAWCDRIILNQHLKNMIDEQIDKKYIYGMLGEHACMGDHKPIYLFFNFKNGHKKSDDFQIEPVIKKLLLNGNSSQSNLAKSVYINKIKTNLLDSHVDLHDFAQITYINRLKPFQKFETYSQYFINEQLTPISLDFSQINLNILVQSIAELILELSNKSHSLEFVKDSSFSSISHKSLLTCASFCTCKSIEQDEANCLFKFFSLATLFKSYLVNFFLLKLNGNFFKLKHLISFLNEICVCLENLKSEYKRKNENEQIDLDKPFENSFNMLYVHLKESQTFLTLPCTYKLFKLAINEETKLLNLKECHQSEICESVSNSSHRLSLNNNDVKCDNLNDLLDKPKFSEVETP